LWIKGEIAPKVSLLFLWLVIEYYTIGCRETIKLVPY
jgi:hypothetical protein